jgi:D-tyrosyl-tRNA(Tyr) deacylase
VGAIAKGILALIGVERNDAERQATACCSACWPIAFSRRRGPTNLDLGQAGGGLLLVPQFTLAANTRKGNRPSFTSAAEPGEGERLFRYLAGQAASQLDEVATGRFGAAMQVRLVNDGPVTFWLQVAPPGLQVPPPGLRVAPPGSPMPPAGPQAPPAA